MVKHDICQGKKWQVKYGAMDVGDGPELADQV
jgi:hypothetical protein